METLREGGFVTHDLGDVFQESTADLTTVPIRRTHEIHPGEGESREALQHLGIGAVTLHLRLREQTLPRQTAHERDTVRACPAVAGRESSDGDRNG